MNYKEYGGAPLLGVTKPVIKAHGSSDKLAISKAHLPGQAGGRAADDRPHHQSFGRPEGRGVNEDLHTLEQRLGHRYENIGLLQTALTHPSYVNENRKGLKNNQRLEFLGDSVLSIVVAQ